MFTSGGPFSIYTYPLRDIFLKWIKWDDGLETEDKQPQSHLLIKFVETQEFGERKEYLGKEKSLYSGRWFLNASGASVGNGIDGNAGSPIS